MARSLYSYPWLAFVESGGAFRQKAIVWSPNAIFISFTTYHEMHSA
jgi:hypothetical protein